MIRLEGDVLRVEGPVTLQTVPGLLSESAEHLANGVRRIDFSAVTEVDSAAVALALEWQRRSVAASGGLELEHLPQAMQNLAQLYGV